MQLLDQSTWVSKQLGEFLVVRFGDKRLKEASCCEFYLVKQVPPRPYTDTTSPDLPLKTMPEHAINYLLARFGSPSGIIGPIAMKDENNRVVFSFDQKAERQYSIKFSSEVPGEPKKIAVPWHGGIFWQLTFAKNYEPNWASRFYESPSHPGGVP